LFFCKEIVISANTQGKDKVFLILALIFVAVFFCLVLAGIVFFALNPIAGNSIIERVYSSDNINIIYIFDRNAGAKTGYSTQVSIIRTNRKFGNSIGNTFVCDDDHGKVKDLNSIGGPNIKAIWISNNNIVIYYPKMTRIYKKKNIIGSIRIEYEKESK
jgi:hypothetical protein